MEGNHSQELPEDDSIDELSNLTPSEMPVGSEVQITKVVVTPELRAVYQGDLTDIANGETVISFAGTRGEPLLVPLAVWESFMWDAKYGSFDDM